MNAVFTAAEMAGRHKRVREAMERQGIDCLLVAGHLGTYGADAADVRYLTDLPLVFGHAYVLFPATGFPVLLAPSPSIARQLEAPAGVEVEPVAFRAGTRIRDDAAHIVRRLKEWRLDRGTVGIASLRTLSADVHNGLRIDLPRATFVPAEDLLLELRSVKSVEEQECVRRSAAAADRGLAALVEAARPGATERDLAAACDCAIARAGADRGSFILLRSGPWEGMHGPIGLPTERRIEQEDVVLNEITADYAGYYTQLCVPLLLGRKAPDSLRSLLAVHQAMHEVARQGLRPGRTVSMVDAEVARVAGMYDEYRRAWALQSCELAEAFSKKDVELRAGMAFVDHPWTELPTPSAFEGHTIGSSYLIREDEPEALNMSELSLIMVH